MLSVPGKAAILVSTYNEYKRSKRKIPIGLTPESLIHVCCSHIELLHQLHYNIQKNVLGKKKLIVLGRPERTSNGTGF